MARCIKARSSKRPLRIANKFPNGGEAFTNFMSGSIGNKINQGTSYFDMAAHLAKGEQPSILDITGATTSGDGLYGAIGGAVQDTGNLISGISTLVKKKQPSLETVIGLSSPYAYGGPIRKYALAGPLYQSNIQQAQPTVQSFDPNQSIVQPVDSSLLDTKFDPNLAATLPAPGASTANTGSSFGLDEGLDIAKGVAGVVGNAFQTANNIKDTSGVKDKINTMRSMRVNDNSLDAVQKQAGTMTYLNNITKSNLKNTNVGQDIGNVFQSMGQGAKTGSIGGPWGMAAGAAVGLLGSTFGLIGKNRKLINETRKINKMINSYNAWQSENLANAAENAYQNNFFNTQANYSALGGPIYPYNTTNTMGLYKTGDALGWDYLQDRLSLAQQQADNEGSKEDNLFASGGGIHINPKNKGKLTATAKRTGKSFSELAHSKNPLTRKRAIFALNARHFNHKHKHALGGDLQSNGADWDLGFTTIGNGGTHEMNPNEGVQMGMDNQGIPNLVEQGEVIFDNYVFSNRLAPSKEVLKQFKLPVSFTNKTFAQIAELISRESKERPNDPISKNGLQANMQKLLQAQELIKKQEQDRRTREAIDNMSPEELQGLMAMANQGMQQQAQDQAMQEQAAQEQMMAQQGIDPNALGAEALYGACGGRLGRRFDKGGDLSQEDINKIMKKLMELENSSINLDALKKLITQDENNNWVSAEGFKGTPTQALSSWYKSIGNSSDLANIEELSILRDYNNALEHPEVNTLATWMQYAPFLGDLSNLAYTYFNKPNMSYADQIQAAADAAGQYSPIRYNPVGNYLQYTPMDMRLGLEANAQALARTQGMLKNASNGNRGALAAYLANSNYNAQLANSQLLTDALKYNQEQRQKVAEFNRGTNLANSQMALEADKANLSARQAALNSRLSGTYYAQAMKNELDKDYQERKQLALYRPFYDLGMLGERNVSLNRERTDPANLGIYFTASGKANRTSGTLYPYLGLFGSDQIVNPETQTAQGSNSDALGGYIRKNKKRRRNHG